MQSSILRGSVPNTGRIALAALSAITGYGAFYHYTQYSALSARWTSIKKSVATETPVELTGLDARFYPWVRENSVKDWEFKPVTLKGYFKDERFFVRRQRDGKDGFLVFAAFVTAVDRVNSRLKQKDLLPIEHSVFVNIGWVPFDRKDDVELGGEVVSPLDAPTDSVDHVEDFFTGFNPDPENVDDTEQVTLYEITGIVRRGESQNILAGRRNWNAEGIYNWVDLDYMGKLFRLFNLDSLNTAYIERIVPVPEEGEEAEELYPTPSNSTTFEKPLVTPCSHKLYAGVFSATSVLSIATALLLRR